METNDKLANKQAVQFGLSIFLPNQFRGVFWKWASSLPGVFSSSMEALIVRTVQWDTHQSWGGSSSLTADTNCSCPDSKALFTKYLPSHPPPQCGAQLFTNQLFAKKFFFLINKLIKKGGGGGNYF